MSDLVLEIGDFLKRAESLPVIDVRAPAEYTHAHIPGAVNMPLFSNEERSIIGTMYLKKGSASAIRKGLEFIRPKMKDFSESGRLLAPQGEALMHCWRGGMRSSSMAWLMNTVGIKTFTLKGGYKSYRSFAAENFAIPLKLAVLGGMTGSGKTAVLEALRLRGRQVIDLEQIARHRGSVFGAIGMPVQPSTEQFENDLFTEIMNLDRSRLVFTEDESLAVGKVFLPRPFYDQMSSSDYIQLEVPFEKRVNNLVREYSSGSQDQLINAVVRIERRLGLENATKARELISKGEYEGAAVIILKYYDKVYKRSMSLHNRKTSHVLKINDVSPGTIAERIISITESWK